MAQTIQIVPKFSFPSVETYINDYTVVQDSDATPAVVPTVKQAYAFKSSKGIDNVWVLKSDRKSAVATFGDSNFKKYGQPLMQALNVVDQEYSDVWMMRVMPYAAAYATGIVNTYYRADTTKGKFYVAHIAADLSNFTYNPEAEDADDLRTTITTAVKNYIAEHPTSNYSIKNVGAFDGVVNTIIAKYSGRGSCGNNFSLRIVPNKPYEKDFGISLYDFDVIDKEDGYNVDAKYVGSLVSSTKYNDVASLIDDILVEAEVGVPPIDVFTDETNVETMWKAYVKFCKAMAENTTEETQKKEWEDAATVELDKFDSIYGQVVGSTTGTLKGFTILRSGGSSDAGDAPEGYVHPLTDDEYIVDLSSVEGLILKGGSEGLTEGETFEEAYEADLAKAFDWTNPYDDKIKSNKLMDITVFFDANYPISVKDKIINMVAARNNFRAYMGVLDAKNNFITKATTSGLKEIHTNIYSKYNDMELSELISFDITSYTTHDASTNKRCEVSADYFMSAEYVNHVNNYGYYIPFVYNYCQLSGHVKNSIKPIIYDYETNVKEALNDYRFNYFECMSDNVFQRGIQNTMQVENSDLLEENNVTIIYNLKRIIEMDSSSQLYNFADDSVRNDFIEYERAKFSEWVGTRLESFDMFFSISEYEFNHSILHLYVDVVLRGLTKHVTVEIDINKRTYSNSATVVTE